jgi:glycosyltransferase involved in cell wall biosynthesis
MLESPLVSVVMGVRNGGPELVDTLESLTSQQGVDFEIIVVNDGSTDGTAELLADWSTRDPRLVVLQRSGRGLTASLIEGCQLARGTYLARQDAGDRSLPGRLAAQVACLKADPQAALCSTYVRLLVPEGATLTVNAPDEASLADGLTGPAHHGAVMMLRSAYEQVGGYRLAFHYAQDIDLWTRLVELGPHRIVPHILYEATVAPTSISGTRRKEQEQFHSYIVNLTRARRQGLSESLWLAKAESLSVNCKSSPAKGRRQGAANGAYFIAACLEKDHPQLAAKYFRQALDLNPLHMKARLKLFRLR